MPTSDVRERLDTGGDRSDAGLADCELSTELTSLVERVCQSNLPWVVVAGSAVAAWQERDPVGWEKVSAWLAVKGVSMVSI